MNYTMYHCHSDYSLLDSCSKPQEYIDLAVSNGQKAIAFSEHGKPLGWVSKKLACDAAGIKFIHAVEIYLTESLEEKVRDNYHTVLIARNYDGIRELNELVTKSCQPDHFYYTNRISFDEFLGISDNIISTSACLASPLNRLGKDNPYFMKLANKYTYLEIQPHNCAEQAYYNDTLNKLSAETGIPLIAGTDTHCSSEYKSECRRILLQAKHKSYGDEDEFDLSFKTYDQLSEMFAAQGMLQRDVYLDAIERTNELAENIEDFRLDTTVKYPILYGSREADSEKFTETVERKFAEKCESGIIPESQIPAFRTAIDEEMEAFRKLEMTGFMLSMSELVGWCRDNGMAVGTARGSVGGSRVAYVSDITDLNPETWHTNFSRFCNPDRVEPGDIDTDVVDTDRPAIFKYIVSRFGTDKTARVAAYGTLADKAVIEEICRAFRFQWNIKHDRRDTDKDSDNPYNFDVVDRIKKEYEQNPDAAVKKYSNIFKYYDGLVGTKISQSVHPAGMVISPVTLADNYGTFDKDGDECLMLDMDEAHEVGLVKYDFLILKTVKVIRDACEYLGISYPKTNEINFDDPDVWESMCRNQDMIFQFESDFAADSFRKFKPRNIFEMSLVTAGIRPSGVSYRDELLARKIHSNPSEIIDNLLEENNGFLVYQEDIIRFLQQICGLSGSEADTVRRGIAKKKKEVLDNAMPKIIEGYCGRSNKPREESEEELKEFLQVIEDASSYMFNYSHSVAYCLLGYYYGYFRYYYPLQFITSYLNNAANDDDIKTGTEYANKIGIMVTMPKWGFSRSDYYFDDENRIIAKGLSSVKFMSSNLSDELTKLYDNKYTRFVDLLADLFERTSINSRQLDILIKIDFFSEFGNQRELLKIVDMFCDRFKKGDAKQIKKDSVDGTFLEEIVKKYSVGTTSSGGIAKNYTLLDVMGLLREIEDKIKSVGMEDLEDIIKVQNFKETMGYVGYVSGKEEDRRKLYILAEYPLKRKKDGKLFGHSILTKSIGSGKESRFTVFNEVYNKDPIKEGNIIYCKTFSSDGKYFTLNSYYKIH